MGESGSTQPAVFTAQFYNIACHHIYKHIWLTHTWACDLQPNRCQNAQHYVGDSNLSSQSSTALQPFKNISTAY